MDVHEALRLAPQTIKALSLGLCMTLISAFSPNATADEIPWCPAVPDTPFPAPTWADIGPVPDYEKISNNIKLDDSLRLLTSILEKSLARLRGGSSLAGQNDVPGTCLCNCGKSAGELKDAVVEAFEKAIPAALEETRDAYLESVEDAFAEARKTLYEAAPEFRKDVAEILRKACDEAEADNLPWSCKNPQTIPSEAGQELEAEIDQVFGGRWTDFEQRSRDLQEKVRDLVQRLEALLTSLRLNNPSSLAALAQLPGILEDVKSASEDAKDLLTEMKEEAESLAQAFEQGGLDDWAEEALSAFEEWIVETMDEEEELYDAVFQELEAALKARLDAIRDAGEALLDTVVDYEESFEQFKSSLLSGLENELGQIEGCYGVTRKSECSLEDFCAGTNPGQLLGEDLPIWFPTEVFKDGKTAALFALETVDWLDKARQALQNAAAPKGLGGKNDKAKLIEILEDGQELLDRFNLYVDHFSDGYHLGAYSHIRPDLHKCVGYAGHGVLAELFSAGKVRGGASYLSANLSEKHRAQFRSGGFTLLVNEKKLPLAPGLSLNLQIDGFRLWDRNNVFGLGDREGSWTFESQDVEEVDVFNLLDADQLCAITDTEHPCTLTPTSFLYTGFYPIQYAGREWPRLPWEEDHRLAAVLGAGLSLPFPKDDEVKRGQQFFELKTQKWEGPEFLLFPGATLKLSLTLDAGFGWLYQSNFLRDNLFEKLNEKAPGTFVEADFSRLGQPLQAPDVTEDVGHAAHVNPTINADLLLGLKLGRRLEVGVTASLHVGVDVEVGGYGGLLDLKRPFFDALAESNPDLDPDDDGRPDLECRPIIEDNATTVCSNTFFAEPEGCGEDENCVDLSTREPPADTVYSTGEYSCSGDVTECGTRGYCRDTSGKILAHDMTREECEGETFKGLCCVDIPRNAPQGVAFLANVDQETCDALSPGDPWVSFHPGVWRQVCEYESRSLKPDPESCPVEDTVHCVSNLEPGRRSHHHFAEVPEDRRTFHPYSCHEKRAPEITGWEGEGCHPLHVGFEPDVAAEVKEALDGSDQIYTVASYAFDQAIVSVLLGWSADIGLRYKLFRKWKKKELWSDSKTVPLLTLPLLKFQPGLEAPYFDDCDAPPDLEVENHQQELIRRDPGGGTAFDLVERCQPKMESDVQNPVLPAEDVGGLATGSLEDVHVFGKELAIESWNRAQLCIGDVRWDVFLEELESSPEKVWNLTKCAYLDGNRTLDLDCTSAAALERSLAEASGCLDVDTAANRPLAEALGADLSNWTRPFTPTSGGQPVGAERQAFDLGKLFALDRDEDLFTLNNLAVPIRSLADFDEVAWLAALDSCTDGLDEKWTPSMDVGEVELCGGACCENGRCREVDDPNDCAGTFSSGETCTATGTCAPPPADPEPGICVTPESCYSVTAAEHCPGGAFRAGTTCELSDICFADTDCGFDHSCRRPLTVQNPVFNPSPPPPPQPGQCVERIPQGGRCGFEQALLTPTRCRRGLTCVSEGPSLSGLSRSFCRPVCAPRPPRTVAWWPFEQTFGNRTPDFFGGAPGRFWGGARQIDGKVGKAFSFDGEDDRMTMQDDSDLRFGRHDFSIAFWMRSRARGGNLPLLHKRQSDSGWEVRLHGNRLFLLLADGTSSRFMSDGATPVNDGEWHFVVVTVDRDRPDGVRWYIDGAAARTLGGDLTRHDGSLDSPAPLHIAATLRPQRHVAVDLDELTLFRQALSAEEALLLYRADGEGMCQCADGLGGDPVAWWKFDQNPRRIRDAIGDANGTSTGFPRLANGRVGKALSFDGEDDHVDVADVPALSFGAGDFSIEGWIRHLGGVNNSAEAVVDKRRNERWGYSLFVWRGRLGLQGSTDTFHNLVSQIDLSDGQWHHFAVTVDRDQEDGVRWYLDGEPVGPAQDPTPWSGNIDNDVALRLGANSTPTPERHWKGELDELTLYDRVLAPFEAGSIVKAGGLGKCER